MGHWDVTTSGKPKLASSMAVVNDVTCTLSGVRGKVSCGVGDKAPPTFSHIAPLTSRRNGKVQDRGK